jgi:hypothetical protein
MDWSNEEYVRLYTRETADDLELSWEALSLWRALLIRFDRAGIIQVKNGWSSVARLVRMPADVVLRVAPELVSDGRVRLVDGAIYAPNFTEAQTSSKSDKVRQRESRDRRRERASAQHGGIASAGHGVSHAVTPGHDQSQNVTLPLLKLTVASLASAPQGAPDVPAIGQADSKPAGAPFVDMRSKLNHEVWTYAAKEHARLKASGVDRNARSWPGLPVGEGAAEMVRRTLELTAGDPPDYAHARATHEHVINLRAAEAKASGSLQYLIPSRLWASASFWKAAELTPEQATRPRAGPSQRDRANDEIRTNLKPM